MRSVISIGFLLATVFAAPSANAGIQLIAKGSLTGSSAGVGADLSGLNGTLENGLPANILGGIGSGLAYAGGTTFLAVPDRGPNATPFNPAIDDTVSYVSRFHTIDMSLTQAAAGSALPFNLSPTLTKTTLLFSPQPLTYGSGAGLGVGSGAPAQNTANQFYFSGRSDNYGAGDSGVATNARFDPEAIRLSKDGKTVFVSDEYGPYVRQFDRATGKLVRTYTLPDHLNIDNLTPNVATEISGNTVGRTTNKGMEGLAITPDGKTLVGIMQAATLQDAANPATANMVRIVTIDIATGATKEYGYKLTTGSGVSEIVAINDHQFLVDERDGKGLGDGSSAKVKQLFQIDLAGAVDITNLTGAAAAAAAVAKGAAFLDLVTALLANGLTAKQIPSKIEGVAFGQDVTLLGQIYHTLYISNDNDFVPGVAGPNVFYVFGFQDGDLPGFRAQQFAAAAPEPAAWALMLLGVGGVGAGLRLRKRRSDVAPLTV
jgi:hypothetical protein